MYYLKNEMRTLKLQRDDEILAEKSGPLRGTLHRYPAASPNQPPKSYIDFGCHDDTLELRGKLKDQKNPMDGFAVP